MLLRQAVLPRSGAYTTAAGMQEFLSVSGSCAAAHAIRSLAVVDLEVLGLSLNAPALKSTPWRLPEKLGLQ